MTLDLDTLAARLAAPISDASPAGDDVTYEPDFEALQQAVERIGSVGTGVDHASILEEGGSFGSGGGGDHGAVVEAATELLTTRSKDLRAAAYLAASLARTDGAAGLAAGVSGIAALAQTHWAALYPPVKRRRARIGAVEYLVDKLQEAVGLWDAPADDETAPLAAAVDALDGFQLLLRNELGDAAPVLSGLRRALTDRTKRARSAPAATPPPAGASETAPPPAGSPEAAGAPRPARPAARPTPAPAGPAVDPGADPTRAVLQAAVALREADPTSAVAVRLARVARWDALDEAPPATDGTTRIEAPPKRQREALTTLAAADPLVFAEEAERLFVSATAHVWLDLQRLADGALAALGVPYAAARQALRDETARLLGRLPDLALLHFRDGTPFADPATRGWALGLVPEPSGGAVGVPTNAGTSAAFDEAREDIAAGRIAEALDALEAARPRAGRAGALHRLRTADLCLAGGRADLAVALLNGLAAAVDARDLADWEPALASDIYAALAGAARQNGDADGAARAAARLAAIDPARAARTRA